MDSGWDEDNKTNKIELNISRDKVEFFHNGRPPHYRQKIFNHKLEGSEFMSMVWKGSTKRANIGEGRFGIGFKFWTYHFNTAKVRIGVVSMMLIWKRKILCWILAMFRKVA